MECKRSKNLSALIKAPSTSFHVQTAPVFGSQGLVEIWQLHAQKPTQEMSTCTFQKVYLFVLPLITSLFTVAFQPSQLLQITYQNEDVGFLPRFARENLGSQLVTEFKQSALTKDVERECAGWTLHSGFWRADCRGVGRPFIHTHTYTHSSPVSHYTGLIT